MSETLVGALAWASERLAAVSGSPRLDAELLLAETLGCSRSALLGRSRDPLAEDRKARFLGLVERRLQGEPVAYLLGRKEFWSLELRVSPAVLVPRPDTELLVAWALEIIPRQVVFRVADLGTGSGAIALAIAHERPLCEVVATDRSADALELAAQNAQRLGLARVQFRCGDWFRACEDWAPFDLVVSNPPYIARHDPHLAALQHEPRMALTDEADGLSAIAHLVSEAPARLRRGPTAALLLEHGHDQGEAVRRLFSAAGFSRSETRRDLSGHERVTAGWRASP